MNENDYDEDGNNIVPCPLCDNIYCPSKGLQCDDCGRFIQPPVPDDERGNCSAGGTHHFDFKCPLEDEFAKSMMKPKFNVCLIARNEEEKLPHLMGSLKEFQERGGVVYLLDTGSTDNTVKVAKELGCEVVEAGDMFATTLSEEQAKDINEKFIVEEEEPIVKAGDRLFDFAGARNYIAKFSDEDMIATPDCDEVYTKLDIDAINKKIEEGAKQFEYNFVFSHDANGNEGIKFTHSKFYNKNLSKWVGVVHEVLTGNNERVYLGEDIIKLEHFQNEKTNRSNYLRGLALDCFLHPTNDRNSHYLARELMYYGRYKSAIKEFHRHIEMNGWVAERAQSMIFIGDCYGYMGKLDLQRGWYLKAFSTDPERREALIKMAWSYTHEKKWQAVVAMAEGALKIPYKGYYGNRMEHYTKEPHELLYRAYGWLGRIPEARENILKALEYDPKNLKYRVDMKYYFNEEEIKEYEKRGKVADGMEPVC